MPKVNRKPKSNTYIQAILFPRSLWTEHDAEAWLRYHKKYIPRSGAHITKNYFRYRQVDPQSNHTYRIHRLPTLDIDLIIGYRH